MEAAVMSHSMPPLRRFAKFAFALTIAACAVSSAALANDKATPDWPCVWRKVVEIDAGTIWDGPPLDTAKDWIKDDTVRTLSAYVISRRIKVEEIEAAIKKYSEGLPADTRDQKLTELFAAALSRTNDERKIVISGIERFHKLQIQRAKAIEDAGLTLPKVDDMAIDAPGDSAPAGEIAKPVGGASEAKADDPAEKMKWEIRVFQNRQQNIPVACEIPQLMDERIGAVARAVRALMKG